MSATGGPRAERSATALPLVAVMLLAHAVPGAYASSTEGATQAVASSPAAVPRFVVAGGGGASSGGAFAVRGSIAQTDADPLHPMTGGAFAITGGFWAGAPTPVAPGDSLFIDGFE